MTFLLFPSISPLNLSSLESLKDANNIFLGEPSFSPQLEEEEEEDSFPSLPVKNGRATERGGGGGGGKLMVGLRRVRRVASPLLPPSHEPSCLCCGGRWALKTSHQRSAHALNCHARHNGGSKMAFLSRGALLTLDKCTHATPTTAKRTSFYRVSSRT